MQDQDKPAALVTGSASGFGLLTAVELGRAGFRVFASMRDPARRQRLDLAAAAAGVEVEVLPLDVTRPETIKAALDQITRSGARLELLVNNAGYGLGGYFEDLGDDELRAQLETNFFGVAAVTRAVLPTLRERRRGRIITIASINGRLATPGLSAYAASKFAVEGLSEALRFELKPFGIDVVLIEPGTYRTDIFERNRRVAARAHDPGSPYAEVTRALETFIDNQVAHATADPVEVARVVVKAATVAHPRLRYPVGDGVRLLFALRWLLPATLFEALLRRGLPRAMTTAPRKP